MHDCNRHRNNGYRDHTHEARIHKDVVHDFGVKRSLDQERGQMLTNKRFPQLAEARDLFLKQAQLARTNSEYDSQVIGSDDYRQSLPDDRSFGLSTEPDRIPRDADFNTLTQEQRNRLYEQGDSPRCKAIRGVKGSID